MAPRSWLCLIAAVLWASAAQGGTISGQVVEAGTGRPVGGAVVRGASEALQGEQVVQTDGAGSFLLGQLPPGVYSLNLEAQGHQPATQENLVLALDATLWLRIEILREGEAGAAVRRAAQVPAISAPLVQSGGVVARDQAELIPYGRESLGFEEPLAALPGVRVQPGQVSVQEGYAQGTRYLIDGVDVTWATALGTRLTQRFVEQVSLLRGVYPAEFGRSSGAIVHAVTRSGSNEFHGSLFGSVLLFETASQQGRLPVDSARQGGFELGGPIQRDRLWFYAGFAPEAVKIAGNSAGIDYQYVGKLIFRPGEDQSIALSAFGDPQRGDGSNNLSLRYSGKLAGVLLEGSGGVHHLPDDDRLQGAVSAGTFAQLAGHHLAKIGADVSRQTLKGGEGTLFAAFAQDGWAVLDAVFLDAGVRYEAQHGAADRSFILPRLGLSYDFTGRGLSRIYAGIGRFFAPAGGEFFREPVLATAFSAGAQLQFYRDAVASIDYTHKRNFDGVTLSVGKPLSQNYLLQASCALSSSTALYDARSILKLDAAYACEWTARTTVTLGTAVHAVNSSAWAIGVDARAGLRHALSSTYLLALNLDVLNALDHQADLTEGPLALRFGASLSF
jgi:hypothetical protein